MPRITDLEMNGRELAAELELPRSAIILERSGAVSADQIGQMLDACTAAAEPEQVLGRVVRQSLPGRAKYSALFFRIVEKPSFLSAPVLEDRVHGFVLLVEVGSLGALISKYAGVVDRFLPAAFDRLPFEETLALFGGDDAAYEYVSLRTLGGSRGGLLRRSFEALDLRQVMPRAGSRRSAPTSLKVRNPDITARLAPGTGRVSVLGGKSALGGIVEFVRRVEEERANLKSSSFIDSFAQPIEVSDLEAGVFPSSLLFHWGDLDKLLPPGTLFMANGGTPRPATQAETEALHDLVTADIDLAVTATGEYAGTTSGASVVTVKPLKAKYSLNSDLLDAYQGLVDGEYVPLTRLINAEQLFTITYSNPAYAYTGSAVFRNSRLPTELESFLSCFVPMAGFETVTSEKGNFRTNATRFSAQSVFSVVERNITRQGAIVICDDLSDEWADHVVLDAAGQKIEFIHSKWKKAQTTSASAFHDLASQGTKNLGNLTSPGTERYVRKCTETWVENYRNGGVQTAITRIRTGETGTECQRAYTGLLNSVSTQLVMSLAASFLSKAELTQEAARLSAGQPVAAHVVQLTWILASFIDVCRANSVVPRVYCRP